MLRAGPKQHTGQQTCEFVNVDPQLVPHVFVLLKCWILTQLAKRGVLDPVVHTFASELATHLGSHTDDVARHMGCGSSWGEWDVGCMLNHALAASAS